MLKEFIFTLGLPGSGKSSYLDKRYPDAWTLSNSKEIEHVLGEELDFIGSAKNQNVVTISADEIKEYELKGRCAPEDIHEKSVSLAKDMIYQLCTSMNGILIMDGGGVNKHYTEDIINYVKQNNPDVKITCLFFDTPIEVCLKRMQNRERKVPIDAIYDKNQMLVSCVHRYCNIVDEFIRINYFTNKYLILDMDGTIAGYSKARFDEDNNADFVTGELFKHLRPNNHVIEFAKKHYKPENIYICTAVANSIAWQEKDEWLDKYFPEIPKQNRFWCGKKEYKHVFIKQFARYMGWKRNEMVLIDDYHPTIDGCKKFGINCLHPSNIEALIDPYAIFS